jgi:hypothetical protein
MSPFNLSVSKSIAAVVNHLRAGAPTWGPAAKRQPVSRLSTAEMLESRVLFTTGPDTPTFSAAPDPSNPAHVIDFSYTTSDSSALELEEQGPGDPNFKLVADEPNTSPGTPQTFSLSGFTADSTYNFRLKAVLNGLVAYANTAVTTDPVVGSFDAELPVPYDLSLSPDGVSDSPIVDVTFKWDGDPSQLAINGGDNSFSIYMRVLSPQDTYGVNEGSTFESVGDSMSGDVVSGQTDLAYPGETVQYRVQYQDNDNGHVSAMSDWATVTEPGPLEQAPTNLAVTDAGGGNVSATWTAPDDDNYDTDDANYTIWGVDSSGNPLWGDSVTGTTSDTFGAPSGAVEYFVTASATGLGDIAGATGQSGYSNFADAPTGLSAPAAPENLSAVQTGDGGDGPLNLVWDNTSNNEDDYVVQRSTDDTSWTTVTTTSSDVTNTSDDLSWVMGTTYYYRVQAVNGAGGSSFSTTSVTF